MTASHFVAGVGVLITALVAVAWVVRRLVAYHASIPRRDEITFERQYEEIEPEAEDHRGLKAIERLINTLHQGWALLTVLLLFSSAVIAFRSDRRVRAIIAATAATMIVVAAVWAWRGRASRTSEGVDQDSAGPR